MTTKVYRYEHPKTNVGPYLSACSADMFQDWEKTTLVNMIGKHSGNPSRPGIRDDVDFELMSYHLVACNSIKALRDWFKGYNSKLIKIGFQLIEYEVTRFEKGKSLRQGVFDRKHMQERKVII